MCTFRDDFLRADEEKDHLSRIGSVARFRTIRNRMGTISVKTNMKISGEIVYDVLKSRTEIGQVIRSLYRLDSYKRDYIDVKRYKGAQGGFSNLSFTSM